MNYDPALCIVCERCVTVCGDMVGFKCISTVKEILMQLKTFKDECQKMHMQCGINPNKSLIGYDADACTNCGECISVRPVGAFFFFHDFQYTSNALGT